MSQVDLDNVITSLSQVSVSGSKGKNNALAKPNSAFKKVVDAIDSPLTIFQCISDLGFIGWNPNGRCYKDISDITKEDIVSFIDEAAIPQLALPVNKLRKKCSMRFATLPSQKHWNRFPYDPTYLVPMHVAVRHRNVKLEDISFVFGGSTLNMLATQEIDDNSQYIATIVAGTRVLIVAKHKEYEQNFSDPGFQFERYVTGGRFEDKHNDRLVEHMQIMKVGKHQVLFSAESDAIDDNGNPVEIKCSNPRYWGAKVMFQMLSSGSTSLYAGKKQYGKITGISVKSLDDMIQTAEENYSLVSLQNSILSGMKTLQDFVDSGLFDDGATKAVSFSGGTLKLTPVSDNKVILPGDKVVKALLN